MNRQDFKKIKKLEIQLKIAVVIFLVIAGAGAALIYSLYIHNTALALSSNYSKSAGQQLTATEWNNLAVDFASKDYVDNMFNNIKVASGQDEWSGSTLNITKQINLANYGFDLNGKEPHIIVSEHDYNKAASDGNTMDASYCGFTKENKLVFTVNCSVSTNNSSGSDASSFDWFAIQLP
ncbi:MAG: hypothetical protein PHT51_02550 [Patescibacteria group bacterium]|nr:hypothetical protein [Patescibacteria group bacterium]